MQEECWPHTYVQGPLGHLWFPLHPKGRLVTTSADWLTLQRKAAARLVIEISVITDP